MRIGRFEFYRVPVPRFLLERWWIPEFGFWNNSARYRNFDWFGYRFTIERKHDVIPWIHKSLNRRFDYKEGG